MRVRSSTSCAGLVHPEKQSLKLPRTPLAQPCRAVAQHKTKRQPLREATGGLFQSFALSSRTWILEHALPPEESQRDWQAASVVNAAIEPNQKAHGAPVATHHPLPDFKKDCLSGPKK